MATDFREKEREFIDSLAADTGRDLAGWMAAISSSGLSDRNAIIDFLRRQGFLFARASWLERIHHNGGKPIYAGSATPIIDRALLRRPRPASVGGSPVAKSDSTKPDGVVALGTPAVLSLVETVPRVNQAPVPTSEVNPAAPAPPAKTPSAPVPQSLDALLADAKAYRALALYILREITAAVPDHTASPADGYIALGNPDLFAVLAISGRELRLGVVRPASAPAAPFTPARFPKSHAHIPPAVTHAVALTDARQITPALIADVKAAALREA